MATNQTQDKTGMIDDLDLADVSSEDEEEHDMMKIINNLTKRISENPDSMSKIVEMNEKTMEMIDDMNNQHQDHKKSNK